VVNDAHDLGGSAAQERGYSATKIRLESPAPRLPRLASALARPLPKPDIYGKQEEVEVGQEQEQEEDQGRRQPGFGAQLRPHMGATSTYFSV
jgi:hypothetical protein